MPANTLPVSPLPRGPHKLGRDAVSRSQRMRLTGAVTALVAEAGYAAVTIRLVAQRAKVSYATFYEHFTDKEDCFLTAYDEVVEELHGAMAGAVAKAAAPRDALRLGIEGYLSWFAAHPDAAATFLIAIRSAGPAALERRAAILTRFEDFVWAAVQQAREQDPALPALERTAVTALVLTVDAMAHEEVRCGRAAQLAALLPKAMYVALVLLGGHASVDAEGGEPSATDPAKR